LNIQKTGSRPKAGVPEPRGENGFINGRFFRLKEEMRRKKRTGERQRGHRRKGTHVGVLSVFDAPRGGESDGRGGRKYFRKIAWQRNNRGKKSRGVFWSGSLSERGSGGQTRTPAGEKS